MYLDIKKSSFAGYLLVDAKPWEEYQNGKKTGKILGTTYTIAMTEHQLDKIAVHIASGAANLKPTMQQVSLKNLVLKLYPDYRNAGEVGITATAEGIFPISKQEAK